jgi:hypothetical protein
MRMYRARVFALLVGIGASTTLEATSTSTVWGQAQAGGMTPKQREYEKKALAAFAAGRYQDAVYLYADLYGETHEPVCLRNIGRCYQRLKDPERAISSFEEYLSRVKRISALEEEEINGYIREMKKLKEQSNSPAAAGPVPVAMRESLMQPVHVEPVASHWAPPAASAVQTAAAPGPPPMIPRLGESPQYQSHGLSMLAGGAASRSPRTGGGTRTVGKLLVLLSGVLAVSGGVTMAAAWSKYSGNQRAQCLTTSMGCSDEVDNVRLLKSLSQLCYLGAVATGVTGGLMWYLNYSSETVRPSVTSLQVGVSTRF